MKQKFVFISFLVTLAMHASEDQQPLRRSARLAELAAKKNKHAQEDSFSRDLQKELDKIPLATKVATVESRMKCQRSAQELAELWLGLFSDELAEDN